MTNQREFKSPPSALMQPLLELRDYYAQLVWEYERKISLARSQLAHAEALLSNSVNLEDYHNELPLEQLNLLPMESNQASISAQKQPGSHINSEAVKTLSADRNEDESKGDDQVEESSANDYERSSSGKAHYSNQNSDVPMRGKYKSLTRIQAIEQILDEHSGSVCHIDFIVRSLYGDLEPTLFKVIKGRVHSSLTHGKEHQYWDSVRDEPGCYTFDLNLLPSRNGKVRSKPGKSKQKKTFVLPKTKRVPMASEYDGQFLIDAICSFLQENAGTVFTVAEIINGVYGDLEDEQLREIRSCVLGELSRGYRLGKFSRVPDKVGYYTWDLSLTKAQR